MIRRATYDDVPSMLEQAKAFRNLIGGITSEESMWQTAEAALVHGIAFVSGTTSVTGFILGVKLVDPSTGELVLFEQAWWASDKRTGGLLLRAFERAAKEEGCKVSLIGVLRSAGEDAHSSMLRLGYEAAEVTYRKRL